MKRLSLFFFLAACGGGAPQPGGTGGGAQQTGTGGSGGSSSFTGSCCINQAFYACNSAAAFDKCSGGDPGACFDACAFDDFACMMRCSDQAANATHDPSACSRDSSKDGTCGTSSTSCNAIGGVACTYSSQCSSGNCTDGHCYGNSNGNRCTYSSQCTSGNCTNGCCYGNSRGESCTYSSQCTSSNCTGGKCQ